MHQQAVEYLDDHREHLLGCDVMTSLFCILLNLSTMQQPFLHKVHHWTLYLGFLIVQFAASVIHHGGNVKHTTVT